MTILSTAISQSNYIPWKGYFDLIAMVDQFVIYDEVQYTRRDWRNRNIIKTANGLKWLSIPVSAKGKYLQRIDEVVVSDLNWRFGQSVAFVIMRLNNYGSNIKLFS